MIYTQKSDEQIKREDAAHEIGAMLLRWDDATQDAIGVAFSKFGVDGTRDHVSVFGSLPETTADMVNLALWEMGMNNS